MLRFTNYSKVLLMNGFKKPSTGLLKFPIENFSAENKEEVEEVPAENAEENAPENAQQQENEEDWDEDEDAFEALDSSDDIERPLSHTSYKSMIPLVNQQKIDYFKKDLEWYKANPHYGVFDVLADPNKHLDGSFRALMKTTLKDFTIGKVIFENLKNLLGMQV
jgi:hypothetical protein